MSEKNGQKTTKKQIISLLLVAVIALGGVWVFNYANDDTNDTSNSEVATQEAVASAEITNEGKTVSYEGVEGVDALTLLKRYTTPNTDEFTGLGEYVVGINEVEADSSSNYWALYVNDESSQVGAGDYITKSGDKVEWRLEDVTTFDQ